MTEQEFEKKEYTKMLKKDRKKWSGHRNLVCSILLIISLVIGLFLVRPVRSVIEKRELAELPKMSWKTLWDGSYFTGLSSWYTDTYPLWEKMLSVDTAVEKAYGIKKDEFHGDASAKGDEIPDAPSSVAPVISGNVTESKNTEATSEGQTTANASTENTTQQATTSEPAKDGTITEEPEAAGNIYITGGRGFNVYYFDKDIADYYASMVNTLRARIPQQVHFYEILAPTAFGVCLSDDVQKQLGGSNQAEAMRYIFSMISDDVQKVDVMNTMKSHNSEYLYFGTDHHWTARGAWYAYSDWCLKKGIAQNNLDQFEKKEFTDFLGTFYAASNQSESLRSHPDTVEAFVPMATNDMVYWDMDGNEISWPIINDVSSYDSNLKYCTFIGADEPLSIIENPNLPNGQSIILLKESYGNAFAPFLVDHYKNVIIVDYRYYSGNVNDLISKYQVSDVILLNNMEALTEGHVNELLRCFPE